MHRTAAAIAEALQAAVVEQRLPVPLHVVPALAHAAEKALPRNTPVPAPTTHGSPLTSKPRALPDDARAIAARLDTTWSRP